MAQESVSEREMVMNGNCSEFIDSTLNLYRQLRERGLDAYTFMYHYEGRHVGDWHSDTYLVALPDEKRNERGRSVLLLQSDIKLLSQYERKSRGSVVHNLPINRIISEGKVERAKIIDSSDITNLLKDGFSRQIVY